MNIQVHVTEPPEPRPVIRFWCGRCWTEVASPVALCLVCSASAAEVRRHIQVIPPRRS